MAKHRYSVGDKVLVSRDESGENHEPGTVIDSYELIIGEERRPVVVVEFEDGERKYMTAATPNVLPVEPEEDEATAAEGKDEAGPSGEADEGEIALEAAAEASGNGAVILADDELGSP
jgi:hypothetical protein